MLSFAVKLYLKFRYESLKSTTDHPDDSQALQLSTILQEVSSTSFGMDHGLTARDTYTEFNKKVPIRTYEEIVPYIDRMLEGEPNVLWHGVVKMFAKSSGTTNAESKYLPVSNEAYMMSHHGAVLDMLALYATAYPDTMIFDGKYIGITGSLVTRDNGITVGDISALMCNESPWWTEFLRVPNKIVALAPDWNQKSTIIADTCSEEDVRMLSGVPTWISVILEKAKNKKGENFWPNLELIAHGGVAFGPYKKLFDSILAGRNIRYWQSYNASEGFFATQDSADRDDMLLLVSHGIFYEFITLKEFHNGNFEKIITLKEVELGTEYALIITTNSGLIRYSIGDTIKFTSLKPYRIVVTGRTKFFLNAFGEELVVENTDTAITHAQIENDCSVVHYTVAPIFMDLGTSGGHVWYVEFEKEPSSTLDFITCIDEKLKTLNSDYKAKRGGDTVLGTPTIKVVPSGTFKKWLKSKNKYSAQSKIPPLSNDMRFCNELEEIINNT